jgi:hypothetical protein
MEFTTGTDTPWSLSIQPEPQGRGFELSFEIRDGLDRNVDRSRDLLKIRVPVPSDFRAIRNHWNPTHREQRTARFSLSITDLKGISFHRRKHEEARANTRKPWRYLRGWGSIRARQANCCTKVLLFWLVEEQDMLYGYSHDLPSRKDQVTTKPKATNNYRST